MSEEFQVVGTNPDALFTLKIHRGDGMALLAMNWKKGKPPNDFVGFAIEYREPGGIKFFPLNNRLAFPKTDGGVNPNRLSTRFSPIQKFRWVHFPRNAEKNGDFTYRVTPVFMDDADKLSYGEFQEASLELRRETFPGKLNVCFTRGFVSSQAFVDKFGSDAAIATLLPAKAKDGLDFTPTHPKTKQALEWMGFEARSAILEVLDQAIVDKDAKVGVVAYDLNEPGIVSRLEKLKGRVRVIIDDEGDHGATGSAENKAEQRLIQSAGAANVKRQHMGALQHNKTIVVDGPSVQAVICGSTNLSWRGFFVQSNNAIVMRGPEPVKLFSAAFEAYFSNDNDVDVFGKAGCAQFIPVGQQGINARLGFSPYSAKHAQLEKIAKDISEHTHSSLLFSLAFLFQTPGPIASAVSKVIAADKSFVFGISDKDATDVVEGGIEVQTPDGKRRLVSAAALQKNIPEPFKREPIGGGGTRMHHKFVVIDFDKPTGRVYTGSYNFSGRADRQNGENLMLIRDRRVAVSYMIEAIRIFDHYEFRLVQQEAKDAKKELALQKPPRQPGEKPWWSKDYTNERRIRDRKLFA